jgi:hypothetical protein
LAEGRRIERPWLITTPWFSGVASSTRVFNESNSGIQASGLYWRREYV